MKNKLLIASTFLLVAIFMYSYLTQTVFSVGLNIPRGVSGDFWADAVFGQPNFGEGMVKERVAFKANLPGGVHIDRSVTPNRIYVNDAGNSRILAYESVGTCSQNSLQECTNDSDCGENNTCELIMNKPADLIIGQPNVSSGSCNGDANMQSFPYLASPSASTLCSMLATQVSPLEGGSYASFDTDTEGNLYFPDWQNNRVLKYNNPLGTNDRVADAVWGQTNFNSALCNKGLSTPSASSFCFSREGGTLTNEGSSSGHFSNSVTLDPSGNLWVVDTRNHRVLRFPKVNGTISFTADLVLGQTNFTSNSYGTQLNKLTFPEAVAVGQDGTVYVVDGTDRDRVIKYSTPLQNGMSGTIWGSGFNDPVAIRIDPQGQGIWVSDNGNHMIQLWNTAGTQVLKVLLKDTYGGTWPPNATCNSPVGYCWMLDTRGSIGITSDGDVWIPGSQAYQNVLRYKGPIPNPVSGVLVEPDYGLFSPPNKHNLMTGRSLFSPSGVTAVNNQLIVSDTRRILFWNNPSSVNSWTQADGVIGVPNFSSESDWPYSRMVADEQNHLYVLHDYVIEIFETPLQSGEMPMATISAQLQTLENETINLNSNGRLQASGLAVTPTSSHLWIAHPESNRVVRIKDPLTNPKVDVVLGQLSASRQFCNLIFGREPQPINYNLKKLCSPGSVSLDLEGNVYVSDAAIEDRGNKRMVVWDIDDLPTATTSTIYAPAAKVAELSGAGPLQVAFDSMGHGVVGYNDYQDLPIYNSKHSLNTFTSMLVKDWELGQFNDYFVMPYALDFDENDNLYVVDLNRFRVLRYDTPFLPSTQIN